MNARPAPGAIAEIGLAVGRVIAVNGSDCRYRSQRYLETVSQIHEPATVDEAVDLLASLGAQAAPLAGGTWVMREAAPLGDYVALRHVGSLHGVETRAGDVRIGALATHTDMGA